MWKCFWLLLVFCLQQSVVMSLSLCAGNVVLECDETRDFNTFTCTGFTAPQTVLWKLVYDTQIITLGSCPPLIGGTSTCHPGALSKAFRISRASATASSISAFRGTILSTYSEKGSLTCSSQEGNDETTCLLDYIYRASGSMCEVYFSTVSTWSVVVNCSINKTRSVRRRYSCQLRQHDQVSGTTVLLPAVQMSVTQTSPDGYVSGVCNITSYLPSEGQYTYEVFITPGNVNVSANFIGSNIIRRPAGSLTHNCPQYVTGADLNCRCAVSDLGSPPGALQWNNTVSSQLSLKGLRRKQHGENYVCSLTWNRTVQQSLTYTLIMTYPTTCDDLISAEFSRGQRSGLGIGLGVAAAEAVIVATLVLVFFWRRKRQTSNTRGGRKHTAYSSREDILSDKTTELNSLRSSGHDENEQESAYEAFSSGATGQKAAYTNVEGSVLSRKTSNTPDNAHL